MTTACTPWRIPGPWGGRGAVPRGRGRGPFREYRRPGIGTAAPGSTRTRAARPSSAGDGCRMRPTFKPMITVDNAIALNADLASLSQMGGGVLDLGGLTYDCTSPI